MKRIALLSIFFLNTTSISAHGYTITYYKQPQALHAHATNFIPQYSSFTAAMGPIFEECKAATTGKFISATAPKPAAELLIVFEKLYEQYHPAQITPDEKPRIPKIIHQIWLGSRLPAAFKRWQESWLATHPDWTYILWTDTEQIHSPDLAAIYPHYRQRLAHELMPLYNQDLYNLAPNYGAKSDILRIEILRTFGGVYIDMDIECIESLAHLHHCYDFYAGIEALEFLWLSLNNGIIGSIPHHPILEEYAARIHEQKTINASVFDTQSKTGPLAFTRAFWTAACKDNLRNIAFPSRFFGPIDRFGNIVIWPETFACQYFTHSWVPHALTQLNTTTMPSARG